MNKVCLKDEVSEALLKLLSMPLYDQTERDRYSLAWMDFYSKYNLRPDDLIEVIVR